MKLTLIAIFRADDELRRDDDDEADPPTPPMSPPPTPDPTADPFKACPKLAAAEFATRDELAPHKLIANG